MQKTNKTNPDTRFLDLDGIRGWAAISVVVYHIFWEGLGAKFPEFRNWPFACLANGSLAVAIFFVLSGEALSVGFWKKRDVLMLKRMSVRRYPRLTVPIFFSCLLTYLLLLGKWKYNYEAGTLLHSMGWLRNFLANVTLNPLEFLKFSLWGVYFVKSAGDSYNAFLWTMGIEMLGSLLVFLYLYLARNKAGFSWPLTIVIWLLCYAGDANLSCFVVGSSFAYFRLKGSFVRLQELSWSQPISFIGACGALILSGVIQYLDVGERSYFVFIAPTLLFCLHINRNLSDFFSISFSRWLGKISFPIYLVHFSVIVSFLSWAALQLDSKGLLNPQSALIIGVLSFLLALVLSIAFLPIEILAKRAENLTERFVIQRD